MIEKWAAAQTATAEPSHVPAGSALLARALAERVRGIRDLGGLHRRVDRAPPRRG